MFIEGIVKEKSKKASLSQHKIDPSDVDKSTETVSSKKPKRTKKKSLKGK
jgi:hypothetical protein